MQLNQDTNKQIVSTFQSENRNINKVIDGLSGKQKYLSLYS